MTLRVTRPAKVATQLLTQSHWLIPQTLGYYLGRDPGCELHPRGFFVVYLIYAYNLSVIAKINTHFSQNQRIVASLAS